MSVRLSLFVILLLTSGVLGCNSQPVVSEFSPALFDELGRPSLGYLEHRGTMYDLRDGVPPGYRAGGGYRSPVNFNSAIADCPPLGMTVIEVHRSQRWSTNTMELDSSDQSIESGSPWIETDTQIEDVIIPREQLFNPAEVPTQSFDREP